MASIIKIADISGIKETLLNFYKALRNFLATKTEMDVVATALTDLDQRIDEAMPNISVGTVTTVDSSQDAKVTISGTQPNVVLNFSIPRGKQGDMRHYHDKQIDSTGRVIAYYCAVDIHWGIKLKTTFSYNYSTKMFLPIPSETAMQSQADCISMDYEVGLNSGEGLFNQPYKWANLHWQLQCAKKNVVVYSTQYSTSDSDFYFGIENSNKTPIADLTTVEIVVRYEYGSTYVQANIENSYGRAYYRGSGFSTKPI